MERLRLFLQQSLRVRVLILLALVLAPAFILLVRTNSQERRIAVRSVEDSALRSARVAAAQQEQLADGARQLLATLAQVPEIRSGDPRACDRLMARLTAELPIYANLGAVTPRGDVWCSAVPLKGRVNVSERPYFQHVLETKKFAAGEYQSGWVLPQPSLIFAYPVMGQKGEVEGILYAALDLRWIDRAVAAMRLSGASLMLVVDRRGHVLATYPPHPSKDRIVPDSAGLRRLSGIEEGVANIRSPDGVERLYGVAPLDDTGVRIALGIPDEEAFGSIRQIVHRNLVLLSLVTLFSLVLAWVGGNVFVLRPVAALRIAASRLRRGELEARTGLPHGPGELNQLAQSFDSMAAMIQARAGEQSAVAKAAGAVVRELDLNAVAHTVVQQAMEALAADQAALWILRPGERLCLIGQSGFSPEAARAIAELRLQDPTPAAKAAQTGRIIALTDVLDARGFPLGEHLGELSGSRGVLSLPLAYRGQLVGVLSVNTRRPRSFDADDLRLAGTLGDLFAAAVQNARLFDDVRDALRLREEFLAAAAHELRTPTTILSSYATLMARRGPHDDLERRWLNAVQDATERAVRLSRELVEVDRIAHGDTAIELTAFDLTALVADRVAALRGGPAHRRAWVCTAGPLMIEGDRRQLALAMDAVLRNGLKYQPVESALHVDVSEREGVATVEIRDFGPGIPPERVAHVFEPLFEPWPPGSPHYVGVFGLGLHLAHAIVQAHGGEIEIVSRLGEGSTFQIHLPMSAIRRPDQKPPVFVPPRAEMDPRAWV